MIVVDLLLTYQKRNLKEKIYKLLLLISKSELFTKGSTALVFKIGGMLSIYFFHFFLAKFAGAEANGIFSTFFTLLSIIAVVSILGLDTFLLKKLADFNSKQQWGSLKDTYKKAISIVLTNSIFLSLLLYVLFINGCFDFYNQSDIVYYLIFTIIPFSVLHINAEAFRAIKNIKLFSFFKNFSIFGLAAILLIIANESELNIGVSVFTISVISLSVLSVFLWFRTTNKLHAPIGRNIPVLAMIKESFPMFLSESFFLLMSWVDILMLGYFENQFLVGVYTITLKLAGLTGLILFATNTILGPKISELYHNKNMQSLASTVQGATKFTFLLSLPIFLIIIFFPSFLLNIFGDDFVSAEARLVLIILSVGQIISVFCGPVLNLLNMTNHEKTVRNIVVFAAIINLILNLYLIPHFGIVGAAIATIVSLIFWNIAGVFYVRKFFGFWILKI